MLCDVDIILLKVTTEQKQLSDDTLQIGFAIIAIPWDVTHRRWKGGTDATCKSLVQKLMSSCLNEIRVYIRTTRNM